MARAASDCVDTWILAGISAPDLGSLCNVASRVESGLNELVGKLSTMFGELSCFLSTTVDVQKLVQFTIVYFWQKHTMNQESIHHCQSLSKFLSLAMFGLLCS